MLAFAHPALLAPMEGITDPVFRSLVCRLGGVGAACTEFIRITVAPVPRKVVARYLGEPVPGVPCAVQLMAAAPDHVAASAANAEAAGAAWVDLNFGCPAPVVFGKCAGSGLLCHSDRIAAIVREAVRGTTLPVSAKMRVGITDDEPLERNLLTIADAGAAMITLHARRRIDPYSAPADWRWLTRAVTVLRSHGHSIPLVGNGSIDDAAGVTRMLAETGCDAVMIGRGALADPFIFRTAAGGLPATAAEAVAFALAYADAMAHSGPVVRDPTPKLKQMLRWYRAGGLFDGREDDRQRLLRESDGAVLRDWLQRAA